MYRKLIAACVGLAMMGLVWPASAAVIYSVNRTIGAGTVTGFLETDGTIGVLSDSNFVSSSITVDAPNLLVGTKTLIIPGDEISVSGTALVATANKLFSDFSIEFNQFVVSNSNSTLDTFWCLTGPSNITCGGSTTESIGLGSSSSTAQVIGQSGLVEIATVVPLPAALPLFDTGLALLGFMGWCRKRKGVV